MNNYSFEKLSDKISVCVTTEHKFGTDAFLLADFANVRHKDSVCDLGTGCGIIPMLLAKIADPKIIYGVDIQPNAIEQMEISVKNNHQENIFPICADLKNLSQTPLQNGSIDVVTCNPPYKAKSCGILSELSAKQIARHEVLCTTFDVCSAASKLLRFGGKVCICQRPERLADVICAMRESNLEPKRLRFVAKHSGDKPWLFLIEGKKGSKAFMEVLPTISVYSDNGIDFSKEMSDIYHWDN